MIILEKEDCYCELDVFYMKVAQKMQVKVTDKTRFDCRKICVTRPVQDELWRYYKEEKGLEDQRIATIFLCLGPKANLEHQAGEPYAAEVENGFASDKG